MNRDKITKVTETFSQRVYVVYATDKHGQIEILRVADTYEIALQNSKSTVVNSPTYPSVRIGVLTPLQEVTKNNLWDKEGDE